MVPWVKNLIRVSRLKDAEDLVRGLMNCRDSLESEEMLSAWIKKRFPALSDTILRFH